MGMRVGSSGAAAGMQSSAVSNWQQRQQSFKDLNAALQSGDLSAAQKAYSGLTTGSGSTNSNSPLAKIGQALQNGDLAGAQQAMQALQASRAGHHPHHGTAQAATSTPPSAPVSPTVGSQVNTTA